MAFTSVQSCQGILLKWGTTEIGVVSMEYNRSSPVVIDITGMDAELVTDSQNTQHKLVKKSFDCCEIDLGELTCEFYGPGGFDERLVGCKRDLTVTNVSHAPSATKAFLTRISTQIAAGDLIKGNCTFKLSEK